MIISSAKILSLLSHRLCFSSSRQIKAQKNRFRLLHQNLFFMLLDRQIGISHQALVHFMCHFSSFADCPYNQRLSSVHIARSKDVFDIGCITSLYSRIIITYFYNKKEVSLTSFLYVIHYFSY